MRRAHIFDAVGNKLARGQGIEHSLVSHGNAVVDCDCVEFSGDTAGLGNLFAYEFPDLVEMHVSGDELRI